MTMVALSLRDEQEIREVIQSIDSAVGATRMLPGMILALDTVESLDNISSDVRTRVRRDVNDLLHTIELYADGFTKFLPR